MYLVYCEGVRVSCSQLIDAVSVGCLLCCVVYIYIYICSRPGGHVSNVYAVRNPMSRFFFVRYPAGRIGDRGDRGMVDVFFKFSA